jgi:cytochrome c heme-lyase
LGMFHPFHPSDSCILRIVSYTPPFDRHDWVVERCGIRMRYIIDFYTGHSQGPSSANLSFFLDVRPALDNWEGVKMRAEHLWDRWIGKLTVSRPPPPSQPAKSPS